MKKSIIDELLRETKFGSQFARPDLMLWLNRETPRNKWLVIVDLKDAYEFVYKRCFERRNDLKCLDEVSRMIKSTLVNPPVGTFLWRAGDEAGYILNSKEELITLLNHIKEHGFDAHVLVAFCEKLDARALIGFIRYARRNKSHLPLASELLEG